MLPRIFFLTVLLCPAIASADDAPVPPGGKPGAGHSTHGDAFDEGPRQAAVLLKGMGAVSFPITTQSADAQKFFDQGVAQLHGFWYYEAERSFRQAAKFDDAAPMPYWGLAMANVNNEKRAGEFIKQAVSRREKGSARERLYIDAYSAWHSASKKDDAANKARRTALVKALEKIVFEFPDDLEAKAFLIFQVWDNSQKGIPVASHAALAALAGEVLAKNPMHPGAHHYLIHLWNHEDDRRALKSAALDGQSAPGIAHLWHMPGHTFTALRRYAEAAWQQEAAARTDHAHMIATKLMPEQIHNYAHNNDWLVENLGFIGRVHDAIDLAKNMIELPRLATARKPVGKSGFAPERGGFVMGRKRLLDVLLAWERWDDLLALDGGAYLPVNEDPADEAKRLIVMGAAAFQTNDQARGAAKTEAIRVLLAKIQQERTAKGEEAEAAATKEKKAVGEIAEAIADAQAPFVPKVTQMEKCIAELEFYRALAAPEDSRPRLSGEADAPASGQAGRLTSMLAALKDVPKLRLSQFNDRIGDKVKAVQLAREAANAAEGQVLPLANLADVLWRKGDKQEALDTFNKLRPLCAQADLDQPVFQRLRPVADELKLAADWRPKLAWPADSGQRPDLASLGPFRWHPYRAPDWSLPDHTGETRLFGEFKGRPVLMLFYLGSGCSHCIEQLNTFGPMAKEFAAAGIDLLAVSTERAEELHKTYALAKDDGFAFPILADETLATFKAYRAFDDFETMPLHGTFLIDANGLVRWQDISFQPFTQAKWLLTESKRLLALPPDATAKALTSRHE
jgi:peroxiredoxin